MSWRTETGKGAQARGDLWFGGPLLIHRGSTAGFLSSQAAATFYIGISTAVSGAPPPPTAYS